MPAAFDSDRTWAFTMSAEELWAYITRVDQYSRWWPWLRSFDPGPGLEPGASWRCEVVPPLPYVVRFRLRFDHVDVSREVRASVSGDIRGTARLTLDERGDGTTVASLVSRLAPAHPLLRGFGRVARPLVERGHDWVLDQGQQQFIERGLATRTED